MLARDETIANQAQLERLLREDVLFLDAPPPSSRESAPPTGSVRSPWLAKPPPPEPPPAPPSAEPSAAAQRVPFAQEVPVARRLRSAAMHQVGRIIEQIQSGRPADLRPAQGLVRDVVSSLWRNPQALLSLSRLKTADDYTFSHSVNTCLLSVLIAQQHGLDDMVEAVGLGALLHDIGKLAIPPDILRKPGPLTDEEWHIMRQHPAVGLDLLGTGGPRDVVLEQAVGQHHERLAGTGYPAGLSAPEIGMAGRVVALADIYDAMTSHRPYHRAHCPTEAIWWIFQNTGKHLDPQLSLTFIRSMGIYPVGTLVRLTTGEVAVVAKANPQAVRHPKVIVIGSSLGCWLESPQRLDLAEDGGNRGIVGVLDAIEAEVDIEACLEYVEGAEKYRPLVLDSRA